MAWIVSSAAGATLEDDPAPVSAGQDLAMRLVAYDVEEPVGILTGILSASVYTPFNDDSVLQLTYDLEHDGLASRVFRNEWDIAVQFSYGDGTWHEPPGCRFIPVEESGDNSELGARMEMTAVGVAFDLSSAVTLDGSLLDDQGRRRFHNATPGAYLTSYVASAQSKGVCTALGLDFSSAVDSATATWTHGVSMDIQGNVSAREVLQSLTDQALCDWRMQGNTLQMYQAIPSATSAELVLGREVSSRHEGRTGRELADIVAVIADEGLFRVTHSGRSPRKRGLRARALSQGGVSQEATLALLASSALEQGASTREQVTRDLRFGVGVQHLPFRDYLPGQFVRTTGLNTESASLEEMRVHAITVEMDQEGFLKGAVTLNDRLLDRAVRQSRRIEGIVGGSTLAGGTNAQPLPPPTEQATPEAPTGLSYSASVHTLQAGEAPQGVLTLAWTPIQWDTKGKEIAVGEYEVLILLGDEVIQGTKAMSNAATLRGLPTQSTVTVRVRGISHEGKPGAWSTITADIGMDAEPPPTPSAPLLESNFGLLRAAWDGLSDTGGSMPADFSHLDVRIVGEPNPVGRIGSRYGGFITLNREHGEHVQAFFVAVDTSGNRSPQSASVSVTIKSLMDDPDLSSELQRYVIAGTIVADDILAGAINGWVINGSEFNSVNPGNSAAFSRIEGGLIWTEADSYMLPGTTGMGDDVDNTYRTLVGNGNLMSEIVPNGPNGSNRARTIVRGDGAQMVGWDDSGTTVDSRVTLFSDTGLSALSARHGLHPGHERGMSLNSRTLTFWDTDPFIQNAPLDSQAEIGLDTDGLTVNVRGASFYGSQLEILHTGATKLSDHKGNSALELDEGSVALGLGRVSNGFFGPRLTVQPGFATLYWEGMIDAGYSATAEVTLGPGTFTLEGATSEPGAPAARIYSEVDGSIRASSSGQIHLANTGGSIELRSGGQFYVSTGYVDISTPTASFRTGSSFVLNTDNHFIVNAKGYARLQGGSAFINVDTESGSANRIRFFGIRSSTAAANAIFAVSPDGVMYRSTSIRAAKAHIKYLDVDPEVYLSLTPRDWVDRAAADAYADAIELELDGEEVDYDQIPSLRRIPGLVAEEVAESGNEWLVDRDDEGNLVNVSYERGWIPMIPIVRELRERIMQLEAQHA